MQIAELVHSLTEELQLAEGERDTGASDSSLRSVISLLQRAEHSVSSGQSELAKELFESAARLVSDSWSFNTVLGTEVLGLRNMKNKGSSDCPMKTDVNSLTLDLLQFGSLLRVLRQPELAKNYETLALELRSDPSEQAVEDAREWVRTTLRGGSGGLSDIYVQKKDGSLDVVLNGLYEGLLNELTAFANGSI
jgi:hypothetical protein